MATKKIGISRDLLIHPGETLVEILETREMSPEELSARINFPVKYINKVMSGQRDITPDFAMALGSAFNVSGTFWLNLQANYDAELRQVEKQEALVTKKSKIFGIFSGFIKSLREFLIIPNREKARPSL